jgi:cardiolipin synthase
MLRDLTSLPNLLSILRILLVVPVLFLLDYRTPAQGWALAFLIGLVIASDWADGFLARRFDRVTALGRILDPVADKVAVVAVAFALVPLRGFPLWLAVLLAARDAAILAGGLLLSGRLGRVPASTLPGKVAVNVFGALLVSYMFRLGPAQEPLMWLTVAAAAWSAAAYARRLVGGPDAGPAAPSGEG